MKVKITETREMIIELHADHYDQQHRTEEGMIAEELSDINQGLYDEIGAWDNAKSTVKIEKTD